VLRGRCVTSVKPDNIKLTLEFPDNRLMAALAGPHMRHFARLEQKLSVRLSMRGNLVSIEGVAAARCARALKSFYARLEADEPAGAADLDADIRFAEAGEIAGGIIKGAGGKLIRPRTSAQGKYLDAMVKQPLTFGIGPAGTGKTFLAAAYGASLLLRHEVERLILTRPALEAGERLGFLPGDLKEKIDPYLRPLTDALFATMGESAGRLMEQGTIEVAPLAFMRGRTLSRAFVILDEAQNCTQMQMKMFLTRLGEDSRMCITGDPSQSDLPGGRAEGLSEALAILEGVEGVAVVRFDEADVVRHALVTRIVAAYTRAEKKAAKWTKDP
jgi:phosphate starvation-inducible protein PhoH and related proteins